MTASASHGAALAAYFDIDGTLSRTNISQPLIFLRRRLASRPAQAWFWLTFVPRGLSWLLLDSFSRDASNRAIYACYAGLDAARAEAQAEEYYRGHWRPKFFSAGLRRMEELRRATARLIFISGALDFLAAPPARELGAALISSRLEVSERLFTGRLIGAPLTGARKAQALREDAAGNGVDLSASYAFGDSIGDLEMLECVGRPCAVNPDRRLANEARRRGWPIEHWD
jgi:HAD superfamily hydrolase (TIGR01490 family)